MIFNQQEYDRQVVYFFIILTIEVLPFKNLKTEHVLNYHVSYSMKNFKCTETICIFSYVYILVQFLMIRKFVHMYVNYLQEDFKGIHIDTAILLFQRSKVKSLSTVIHCLITEVCINTLFPQPQKQLNDDSVRGEVKIT